MTARTEKVVPFDCQGVGSGPGITVTCAHLSVTVLSGPDRGDQITVDVDRLYAFVDFTLDSPLALLAITFAVLMVAVARIRRPGGLAISFLVLIKFMIPALLSGEPPLAVGLVGCSVIMFVLLYWRTGSASGPPPP